MMTNRPNPISYRDNSVKTVEEYRADSKARAWTYDPALEELAQLQKSQPDAFHRLGPQMHMTLGFYEDGKAAAAAAGIDTTKGGAAS